MSPRLLVDLEEASFIDASGLGTPPAAADRAAAAGGSLHVTAASPRVRRLLKVAALDRHLLTAPAEAEDVGDHGPALPSPEPS